MTQELCEPRMGLGPNTGGLVFIELCTRSPATFTTARCISSRARLQLLSALCQLSPMLAADAGGIFVTDVSNAARTCLMDIRKLSWDPDLLRRFKLSADMLPRICSNAEVYGHVREGPLAGVPIAGTAGLPLSSEYTHLHVAQG